MITVITVCHKSAELLESYIASFLEHHSEPSVSCEIEFVFVENSGDERTKGITSRLKNNGFSAHNLMVENRGFGAGCNAGAHLARGRLLVFANPDIRFLTDISKIDQLFAGPQWGTIRQKRNDGLDYTFDLLPEYRSLATELARPYRFLHRIALLHRYCYPVGSFMIVPRESFLEEGGFDERFFLYYEEAELSRRLQARLGPPSYSDAVSILHQGFGTQSSSDFTLMEEAKGMVTYCAVTDQPALIKQRVRMLRQVACVSTVAGQRADYLCRAIKDKTETTLPH